MKENEITICQCIEYLDSMVGDDKNVKDCLDILSVRLNQWIKN